MSKKIVYVSIVWHIIRFPSVPPNSAVGNAIGNTIPVCAQAPIPFQQRKH